MKRSIIIIILVAIAIATGAIYLFRNNDVVFSKETSLYKAVPITAPVFVETTSLKSLPLNNPIITELSGISGFGEEINQIRDIEKTIKEEDGISGNFTGRPVILAFDFVGKNVIHPVVITSLKSSKEVNGVKLLIEKMTGVSPSAFQTRKYDGKKVTEVLTPEKKIKLVYSAIGNILIISDQAILVEKCIRQLSTPGLTANKYFNQVNKTVTAQSKISWYINHKSFPELCASFLNENSTETVNEWGVTKKSNFKRDVLKLNDYASWSELDLSFSDNGIAFQGITTSDDTLNQYLSVFRGQNPVGCHAANLLPRHTEFYADLAFSNKNLFLKKLENYYVHSDEYYNREEQFKKIEDAFLCDSRDVFSSLVKDRITAAVTSVSESRDKTTSLFIIGSDNKSENQALFEGMIKSYAKHKKADFNSLWYSYSVGSVKYKIYKFPFPSLPEIWLGKFWRFAKTNYVTYHGNAIVFASSKQELQNYLKDMDSGISLESDEAYSSFESNTDNKSNFSIYVNLESSNGFSGQLFNKATTKSIKENDAILNHFKKFNWKMVSQENVFYNSILLGLESEKQIAQASGSKGKSTSVKDADVSWQYNLNADVANRPQIVTNHNNKKYNEVIVQDANNQLYLIGADGNPVWKNPVPIKGEIMGKIYQIDYYRNGKLQYLFNTKEKIYMIDRLGRNVANFPVVLKSPATNGVNVFDYDNNKKYRYFIACENKKVYAYSHEGKIISGWKFGKTAEVVNNPIYHYRVNNKDYIVFADETKVYIQNRRGETRVNVSASFKPSGNDLIFNNNGIPKIVVTDTKGLVYYLFFDGKYTTKDFGKFSANHKFSVADINGDNKPEFIFTDSNRLTVYQESGKKIFSEKIKKGLAGEIRVCNFSPSRKLIGITGLDNKVYLFEPSGKECKGFPLDGNSDFSVGKLKNGGKSSLLIGNGNRLVNYVLE
jgi:hypothetical protein